MMNKILIFLLFPILITAKPFAFFSISSDTVATGDTLSYIITLIDSNEYKYISPAQNVSLGNFEVLNVVNKFNDDTNVINYKLLFKGISRDSIPQFKILYRNKNEIDSLFTPIMQLNYISHLKNNTSDGEKIKENARQLNIPHNWLFYIFISIFTIGIAFIIITLLKTIIKKRRRKNIAVMENELSINDRIYNMLDELRIPDLTDKKDIILFYYKLTYILRLFIDLRFEINSIDMTSSEFMRGIRKLGIERGDFYNIRDNIERIDKIKYASDVTYISMQKDIDFVKKIVDKYTIESELKEDIKSESPR